MDGIRKEPEPVQLKEIRKCFRFDLEFNLPFIRHPNTGKVWYFA